MKLLFVYNADSGFLASIADTAHKLVSPGTYSCNLCRVTHGAVSMKDEWKTFVASLPYPVSFLHRDEFAKKYPGEKSARLPALFAEDAAGLRMLVPAEEIDKAKNIAEFEELVRKSLLPRGAEKTYRCPECGLHYADEKIAKRCEAWCKEHKSCNLDIIKYAVKE